MDILKKNISFDQESTTWRALVYFNFYRILLSGLFAVLAQIGQLPLPLGGFDERLFIIVSYSYLLAAIIFSGFIHYQFPRLNLQIAVQTLLDIIVLSLLMYSSNGLSSGFGMLLVIAVAGDSILRAGKIAILFAAIATLAVLGHELYIQLFRLEQAVNYTHAGILGATFFFTAFVGNLLSARVKETEALARQRAIELDELARLNEHIVQQIQSGIMVLDSQMNIIMMNESAKYLLKQSDQDVANRHDYIKGLLKKHVDTWSIDNSQENRVISPKHVDIELQISFIRLKQSDDFQILVFVEDIAELRHRAQQLKLASLGRLTASIAHEIRNPLGAINHASQLLKESDSLAGEDKRLTQIIDDHSIRVNNIIENVLSISRREQSIPEKIEINSWLKIFRNELLSRYKLEDGTIKLNDNKDEITISMDPSQLHQVLWNLSENALRYSKRSPRLAFLCGIDRETERSYIDVIDHGPGITEDIKENLFEPFFTTEAKGSGLGLYLARELCEANQAKLNLQSSTDKGTTFRIIFMYIKKKMV